MNKKSSVLRYFMVLTWIVFVTILFWRSPNIDAASRPDTNVYFFPDGQKHSTVNVDVTIVASTSSPSGFINLYYEWWYSNPEGNDYPMTNEAGEIVRINVPDAKGKTVVKFTASNFVDRGNVPVSIPGNYYVRVYSETQNGMSVANSLPYSLRKDTAGKVEIIEINDYEDGQSVGYVWIKINYVGMYTGNDSTITSKVYKIGEDGEWQKYEGQFKVTKNTTIYAEYTDGVKTITAYHTITSIDSTAPTVSIDYVDNDYENPIIKVYEDKSGLASIKYGWVKYIKVDGKYIIDEDGITLWRTMPISNYPVGLSTYPINLDKINDVQGDGFYRLHVIAIDRVGNVSNEVVSSKVVEVDLTGPVVSFDDRGIPQSQSHYEIIINVDESDLGLNPDGTKKLYFFMLIDNQIPFKVIEIKDGEVVYDFTDYNENYLANVYQELKRGKWITRDPETNKLVIKVDPEYFTEEQIEQFNEKVAIYVKAVDAYGNYTLASTEITYHLTKKLPKPGTLFVNASAKGWPYKIRYAQIVLVPEFSDLAKYYFEQANEIHSNNLEVYYTLKYSLNDEDKNAFNQLFIDFGNYKKINNLENLDEWLSSGGWQKSLQYEGGYIGNIVPKEIRITENTGDKVVRVILLDKETGLVEIYDSYIVDGEEVPLSFNNIDNQAPTITISTNWLDGQKVGKSIAIDFEIFDDFGFSRTVLVQYQWTNFDASNNDNLQLLDGKWRYLVPERITALEPEVLTSAIQNIVKTVGDGRNYLWIRVVDSVGNEALYCQEFVIDTTPPVVDLKVRNMNKTGDYLTPDQYHLLLEPTINNSHVKLALKVTDNYNGTEINLSKVLYRWVLDQGNNDDVPWEEVSKPNLALLCNGGELNEEISYVENIGTGYYRLEVKAIDLAGNESEVVSSPVFCIINRAPYEPTITPVLTFDDGSEYGVIEILITTNDPTVDGVFKYSLIKNGDFNKLYNSISKPTFEYSKDIQYIKAKSVNQIGTLSNGYSELYIEPKWFIVPRVSINNLGVNKQFNIETLKSLLHNIRNEHYNTNIITSYKGTNYEFDRVEFAITSTQYDLSNIEKADIVWYENLTLHNIEELIKGDGVYRLWVRVYNVYPVTPIITQPVYKPLYIAYDYVDYVVDNTKPEVKVYNKQLVYSDNVINLLDSQYVWFSDKLEDLNIEIYVNGVLLEGTTIRQDAGIYKVKYVVTDKAGNTTVSDELTIDVRNVITLVGYNSTQTLIVKYGQTVNLSQVTPEIPDRMQFLGWYLDKDYTLDVNSITVYETPITLYGKFAYINTYITLDPNGGYVEQNVVVVPYGSRYVILPTPVRTNYIFLGWYLGDYKFEIYDVPTKDITLVARWEGIPLVLVLDPNNGEDLITIETKYGNTVGSLPTPVKDGYDFVGWFFNGVQYFENSIITQDTVLVAKFEPSKLRVVFNPNNGQMPTTILVEYDTVLDQLPTPTRTGYDFAGWYIDEALTKSFNIGQPITKDIFLYAKWTKHLYTITFNPGDGTFPIESISVAWNERLVRPTEEPKLTNYRFVGWFKNLEDRFPYDFNTPVTEDFTLYAKYVGIDLTVTFKPGNGLADFTVRGTYGEPLKAPVTPVVTGYTFVGWFLKATDEESYDFSQPLTGNIQLIGRWEINEYSVIIDPNNDSEILYLTRKFNEQITAPATPTRNGYIFKGWKANGKVTSFPITVTSDLLIEAIWEPTKVKIYFDDCYSKVYEVEVDYESILKPITIPNREGHTLRAWYRDRDLTDMYNFDEVVLDSFTLYAKWDLNYYRITFETNGGTKLAFYQGFYGSSLAHLDPVVEKEGYTFVGWYKDRYFTEIFDFSKEVMPAYNFTIYAKWEINYYTITFETGTDEVVIEPITLKYGDTICRPEDPVREGYYFAGWYTSPDFDIMYIFGSKMPAEDIVIYARWLQEFSVTFYDGDVLLSRDTVTETYKVKQPNPLPTKHGYQFAGWYTDPQLTNLFDFDTIVTGNINLYAKWETKQTTIYFDANGGERVNPIIGYYGERLDLPVAIREGYQFIGWKDLEGNFVTSVIVPHDDITLTAVWEPNIYTVVFDSQGGSYIPPITAPYGTKIDIPLIPTKLGYYFVGWTLDGEFYVLDRIPARNITLVAVWNQEYTPGLIFELTSDKKAYVVAGYTGSSQYVFVPNEYNGLPVIGIKNNAFANKSHVISIYLSENIATIGSKSFYGMANLAQVMFAPGSKLSSIGTYAFQNTPKLVSINLPKGLQTIGSSAFYNSGLRSLVIPNTVTSIGDYAFYSTKNLTDARFEEGSKITTIPANLFRYSGITSFVVPNTVTTIGDYAFANCANLREFSLPVGITRFGEGILRYSIRVETLTTPGNYRVVNLFYRSSDMSPVLTKVIVSSGSTSVTSSFLSGITSVVEVVLPSSVTSIGSSAFYSATGLKHINIPDNVTTIGSYAFYNTKALANISFGTNTKLTTINNNAFEGSGITSIVIPKTVTTIGSYAFYNTKSLISAKFESGTQIKSLPTYMFANSNITSFVVPNSVTSIGSNAFASCANLKVIYIPNSVTSFGDHILRYCYNLEELTVPGSYQVIKLFYRASDMSKVLTKVNVAPGSTSVTSSFISGISTIKEVVLPEGLKSIGSSAFYSATGLNKINFPNSVETIGSYAFYNTKALLQLPISNESKLYKIDAYAFASSGITEIFIPKGVNTLGTNIFDSALSLSKVEFDKDIKLTIISNRMFYNTPALKTIELPRTITQIDPYAFASSGLVKLDIPYGVTRISEYAMSNMKSLVEVSIPVTVTTFGEGVLRYSTNIQTLTTPGHYRVVNLFYQSSDMSKVLTKVNVSSGSTSVTSSFLSGITSVVEVVLPSSVTSIGSSAFYSATGLKHINIPDNVTTIGSYAFYNTKALANISFGTNTKLTTINNNAFEGSGITSIVIPKTVTTIGSYAFYNTKSLISAKFESGTQIKSLPTYMFANSNITSFVVPNSVTSIGSNAFASCANLKVIYIPNSVTSFGDHILRYCYNLEELTVPGSYQVINLFYRTSDMSKVLTKVNVAPGSTSVTSSFISGISTIKEVVLPEGLKSINSSAFYSATELEKINFPNSVETIGSYAFYNTKVLKKFIIQNESKLYRIDAYAFASSGITEIFIPKGVNTLGTNIFDSALSLSKVEFDKDIKLTIISNRMFYNTPALKTIELPRTITQIDPYAFASSGLVKLDIPYGVTRIREYAMSNMKSLVEVSIPVTVTTFGEGVLRYSTNIQTLTTPGHYQVVKLFYQSSDMSKVLTKVNVSSGSTSVTSSFLSGITSVVEVVLPSSVTSIGSSAFYSATGLKHINIPDNVTTIGSYAFYNTKALANISFGTNTKLTTINNNAFEGSGITSIVIPKTVTTIGSYAFYNTKSLISAKFESGTQIKSLPTYMFANSNITSFVVPNSVTSIGSNAFASCANLKVIYIPNSVTSFGDHILRYCYNLEELTVPGSYQVIKLFYRASDMSKVLTKVNVAPGSTSVTSSFISGISTIKEVVLPEGLKSIGSSAFYSATGLNKINFPNSVETIGSYAFYNTKALLQLPISNESKLYKIDAYAFASSGITEIFIPKGVNTLGTNIFDSALSLSKVEFDKDIKLTIISNRMFYNTPALKTIELPRTITQIDPYAFASSGLVKLDIPYGVTRIREYAMSNMKSLVEVSIPVTVTTFGEGVLRYSTNIQTLTTPGHYQVVKLFYQSSDMSKVLTKVNVSSGSTSVTSSFLSGITSVVEVVLPSSVTSIGSSAFYSATGLKHINIPDNVTTIGSYAFYNTKALANISFGTNTKLTTINNNAFEGSGITSIVIPKTVTTIGSYAFYNTKSLISAKFESGTQIKSLPTYMFANSNITSFVVPNSVTSIGSNAFASCANLKVIYIPNSVTSFGDHILRYCYNLEELTVPGSYQVIKLFYRTSDMSKVLTKVNVAPGSTSVTSSFLSGITTVKEVILPNGITSIGSSAFYGMTNLEYINIPTTVTSIASSAFENTPKLTIDLMNTNYKFTTIGNYAFRNSGIQRIYLPNTLTSFGEYAFDNATKLQEVVFASNFTINNIPTSAFQNTTSLKQINLPNSITTLKPYAFSESGLERIILPNGLKTLDNYCLANMISLKEVYIPNGASRYSSTTRVLNGSNNIEKITFPGNTTLQSYFYNGSVPSSIKEVVISEGTTTLTGSFLSGATAVEKVTLPSTLTQINANAFQNTYPLKTLIIKATKVPTLNSNPVLAQYSNLTIYVVDSLVTQYKSSWTTVASKIKGLSEYQG